VEKGEWKRRVEKGEWKRRVEKGEWNRCFQSLFNRSFKSSHEIELTWRECHRRSGERDLRVAGRTSVIAA
jgi:hypothetical protein